jgi:hypothetical protein
VLTQKYQRSIEVAHEHFAPSILELLVTIECSLNVMVGLKKKG